MENNPLKCLICQDPYPQKGITFFQFPKEETRFKAWVRAVTPLLGISDSNDSKSVEDDLRKNGRICGKHFKEKDFINYKKDSLIHTACPCIGVPDNVPVDVEVQLNIVETFDDKNLVNLVDKILPDNESDTFKCGKCKAQFSILSDFFNHKQSNCMGIANNNNDSIKDDNPPLLDNLALTTGGTFLLNFDNGISLDNCNLPTDNNSDVNNLTNDGNDANQNDVVSFIVSDNSLLIGNPVDISLLTSQLLLTSNVQNDNLDDNYILPNQESDPPQTSLLLTTNVQNEGDDVQSQSSLFLTTSLPNQIGTSNLLLTTDIPDESGGGTGLLITTEAQLDNNPVDVGGELDQEPQDIILNLQLNPISNENDCGIVNNLIIPDLKENQEDVNRTRCSYCGKKFKKAFSVQQHERIHTGERPFQCIICGRAFSQKANVRKHMVRHKVWPKAKQTLKINLNEDCKAVLDQKSIENNCYACQYCSSTFETYFLHKKHMAVHADQKVYRCIQKNCNETFRDLDDFLSHSENHSTAEFQCHVCFKVYTSLEALGAHQYEHGASVKNKTESQTFRCEKCYANFKCAESFKNHLAIESHNYECPQCKTVFTSERFLRRHVLSHLDPSKSKYKCDKCKKVFRTEKYLLSHSFTHSKEKPFPCNYCDKKFASRYRLRRHLALHSGQYFECPFKSRLGCDKKFYRKDKLCDHVATHSNFKFRSCHVCNKTFTSLTKLNLHMKRDHMINEGKQQVLKCLNCSQTFRKEKQLSQHHCTVGERKFKSRIRNKSISEKSEEGRGRKDGGESKNIEIMLVPFVSGTGNVR